jgi:hypothetical protein
MPGNVMMQGNMMLVPADGPYNYNQSQSPVSLGNNLAPPRPGMDNDDLLDVRSFDSMDFFENAQPVLPPMGLKMANGVLHKSSDATTSTGGGTSGSASNSD